MGHTGEAVVDEKGNRFIIGEDCPICSEKPKGKIHRVSGGGFSSTCVVRCNKCTCEVTGHNAIDFALGDII